MFAEWSAECAPDDPLLVVPWSDPADPTGNIHFIDLRENPYDLDHLPEAEHYPPLMQALRSLNASRSPVFTAKCDAWLLTPKSSSISTSTSISPPKPTRTPAGFASYIDILWRDRSLFASFHHTEQLLRRLSRRAETLDHPHAALDCVIRPALVDLTGPQEGFAVSLYIKALGPDAHTASANWAAALESTVTLLRSKEFSPS